MAKEFVITLAGAKSKTINISNPRDGIDAADLNDIVDSASAFYSDTYVLKSAYYKPTDREYVYPEAE